MRCTLLLFISVVLGLAMAFPLSAQILPPSFEPLPPSVIEGFRRQARSIYNEAEIRKEETQRLKRYLATLEASARKDSFAMSRQQILLSEVLDSIPKKQQRVNSLETRVSAYDYLCRNVGDSVRSIKREIVDRLETAQAQRYGVAVVVRNIPSLPLFTSAAWGDAAEHIADELECQVEEMDSVYKSILGRERAAIAKRDSFATILNLEKQLLNIQLRTRDVLAPVEEALTGARADIAVVIEDILQQIPKLESEMERLADRAARLEATASSYEAIVTRFIAPLRDYDDAQKFWGRPLFLENINYNWAARSLNVFVYSDYVGPFRLGSTVNISIDTAAPNVNLYRRRFYQTGGDVVLHGTYLAALSRSSHHTVAVQFLTKLAANRIFSSQFRSFNLDPGVEVYGTITPFGWADIFDTKLDFFRIYGFFRLGTGLGINRQFYESIMGYEPRPFFYGQVVGGIQLWTIRLLWVGSPFAPEGLRQPLTISNFILQVTIPR